MAVKNMAASVLTRLKNQSKEEGISFQMILQLFAQEEFLRRLSYSEYAENGRNKPNEGFLRHLLFVRDV